MDIKTIYNEEVWKDIPGYEGYYKISNFGRVKTLKKLLIDVNGRERVWREKILSIKKRKYKSVELSIKTKTKIYLIHRLVATAFIEKTNGREWVNHIDGDPSNNHYLNLEWCTPSENELHKIHILNIKPSIKNFKDVEHTDEVIRYSGKNIYGKKMQFILNRLMAGESLNSTNLNGKDKKHFYQYIYELEKFGVPIKSKWVIPGKLKEWYLPK